MLPKQIWRLSVGICNYMGNNKLEHLGSLDSGYILRMDGCTAQLRAPTKRADDESLPCSSRYGRGDD